MPGRSLLMKASGARLPDFNIEPPPDFRYDASVAASVVLSGSGILQINDVGITASRHLTQPLVSQQPIYGTHNNRAAIVFDGINDILLNSTNAGTIGVTDVTFFLVGAFISMAGSDIVGGIGVTGQVKSVRVVFRGSENAGLGFGSWANDATDGPPVDAGGASHVWDVAQLGQQVFTTRDNINDVIYPRTMPQTPLAVNATGISMGSLQGSTAATYYTNIAVHEFVGYYSFLTEQQRLAIRTQLMSKWSI